jgi:hypothetical protein
MRIEQFTLRLRRPDGPLLPALQAALAADGHPPLRWAVTAVENDHFLIEGARLCSPSST